MEDVLGHIKEEIAAAMANTEQNVACCNHEERNLKNGVDTFKNRFEMMS